MSLLYNVFLVAAMWRPVIGHANLLSNPSFEEDLMGTWQNNGFDMIRVKWNKLHGEYAIKCANRARDIDGPVQRNLPLVKGRHYAFEGYVKLLNNVRGRFWQAIKVVILMSLPDGNTQVYNIAYRSFCNWSQGWIRLKGDIEAPMIDMTDIRLAIRGPVNTTNFLVDNLTLYELPENPNWRQEADINIERYRKSDIHLNVNLPPGIPPSEVDVQVSLRNHLFAFGVMLRDDLVLQQPTSNLMKLAYYLFNWATVQSYKWKYNKGNPPDINPDFSDAANATDILRANGMKVRGHSIFWNLEKNVPDWVKALRGNMLRAQLYRHLEYMINLARGKLVQWDIQNEHIAGHYYEETLRDRNITKALHDRARQLGDSALLYMNEFQCITSGAQTEQYYDLAMEFLNEGIPLDGLGIQGHTKEYVKPDPTAMWRRIDRLGSTGLELMMTEFDLGWPNLIERADWFEDAIRAFFGHRKMKGVILWDFWSETMKDPNHELVRGQHLKIVEPGERWACLVKKEWNTNVTFNLGDQTSLTLRGFKGDYDVVVRRNNVPVQKDTFSLRKKPARVDITVTDSTTPIDVPEVVDYVPQCISHRGQRSLASRTSSSSSNTLTCRTVASPLSGPGENDATSVSCDEGEVMTGCSTYHMQKKWNHNGEMMELNATTRKVQCTAFNGRGSTAGVRAYARCCSLAGLTCKYRTAGPSFPFDGAMAEAICPSQHLALGCSANTAFPDLDGVKPTSDVTKCQAQSGAPVSSDPAQKSGAHVSSACCRAPSDNSLQCKVEVSTPTALIKGRAKWVTCPNGYVMTSCNAFAESGKSGGARIVLSGGEEKCRVFMGADLPAGSTGVVAYATCCKV